LLSLVGSPLNASPHINPSPLGIPHQRIVHANCVRPRFFILARDHRTERNFSRG
jgi:hypothetical protein